MPQRQASARPARGALVALGPLNIESVKLNRLRSRTASVEAVSHPLRGGSPPPVSCPHLLKYPMRSLTMALAEPARCTPPKTSDCCLTCWCWPRRQFELHPDNRESRTDCPKWPARQALDCVWLAHPTVGIWLNLRPAPTLGLPIPPSLRCLCDPVALCLAQNTGRRYACPQPMWPARPDFDPALTERILPTFTFPADSRWHSRSHGGECPRRRRRTSRQFRLLRR